MPYGLDDAEWDDAKSQMRVILAGVASERGLIEYRPLSERIVGVTVHWHRPGTLSHLLAEIQDDDHAASEPLLPALVVLKSTRRPSDGFWTKAASLGYPVADRGAFWEEQRDLLATRYGGS